MKEHPDYKYRPRRKPKPAMVHPTNKSKSENPKFPFNSLPTSVIRAMDSIAARAPFFSHHPHHHVPHHHHHATSTSSHHVLPSVPTLPVPLSSSGGGAQASSTSPAAGGLPNFTADFSRLFPPFIPTSLSEALFSRLVSGRMANGGSSTAAFEEEHLLHPTAKQQQLADQRASSMSPSSSNGHSIMNSTCGTGGSSSNAHVSLSSVSPIPKLRLSRSPSPSPSLNHPLSPTSHLDNGNHPFSHYPNGSYPSAAAALYSGLYPSPYFHYSSLTPFLGHHSSIGTNHEAVSASGHHSSDLAAFFEGRGVSSMPKKSPVYVVHKSDRRTPSPVVSVV